MKSKVVLWGSNDQNEKLVIAVSLRSEDNKVDIWTFPEPVATDDFYQQLMKEWRDGPGMEFPEPHTHIERELSVADSLLPDEIKVERGDVVQRAQSEWHFMVLSDKLHQAYKDQLEELREKVEVLSKYEDSTWDNLKEFWNRVQGQVRERNLLREHADGLRDQINVLFGKMKELRSKMDEEFDAISKETYEKFMSALEDVEKKAGEGVRFPVLFEELKKLQRQYRDAKLGKEYRNKVYDKIDAAFKSLKDRRFGTTPSSGGGGTEGNSQLARTKHRFEGLVQAIARMETSIKRDRSDLDFQSHKIATTGGQLEAQIRQAKMKMIDERVRSKEEKLAEMVATKNDLEKKLSSLQEKEARIEAQKAAKAKIAQDIKASASAAASAAAVKSTAAAIVEAEPALEEPVAAAPPVEAPADETAEAPEAEKPKAVKKAPTKAAKATEEVGTAPAQEESIMAAVGATVGESLTDVVDTIKAAASIIGGRIGNALEEWKEEAQEMMEEAKEMMEEAKEKAAKVVEEIKEEAKEKAAEAKEVAAEVVEEIKEEFAEAKEEAAEMVEEIKEEVAEAKEEAAEVVEEVKEEIGVEEK